MEINNNPDNSFVQVYIVRAFENIDEEEEKEESDALVEEGNMHTSKAIKESKTVKPKEATKKTRMQKVSKAPKLEPKSKTVKSKEAYRKTRSSQNKKQKTSELSAVEPKEDAHLETVKPEAATKFPNKKKKAKEGDVCEIGDLRNAEKILVKIMEADLGKKKEHVQDVDVELKIVKLDEKASKPAAEKPRKKRAPKFFRKRG
jgi:hypothetical protein